MSKVVIIKNNGKVQQIRQYAEESYNTGEIRYYSTQKGSENELQLEKIKECAKREKKKEIALLLICYTNKVIEEIFRGKVESITDENHINYNMYAHITKGTGKRALDSIVDKIDLDLEKDFEEKQYIMMSDMESLYNELLERIIAQKEKKDMIESLVMPANFSESVRIYSNSELINGRTEYQRDRERVVNCRAFRRMVDKAQIFGAEKGDYFRTRMTHTLEVNQIAKAIAYPLNLNLDLTEAIALGHDLGHTPFGHQGERTLDEILNGSIDVGIKETQLLKDRRFGGFKHNYQSAHILTELEEKYTDFLGLNVSVQVIDGVLKHTKLKKEINIEDFIPKAYLDQLEIDLNQEQQICSTLEGQVVAIADEIAQRSHDVDDAIISGVMSIEEYMDRLKIAKCKELSERIRKELNALDNKERLIIDKKRLQVARVISIIVNYFVEKVIDHSKQNMNDEQLMQKDNGKFKNKVICFPEDIQKVNDYLEKVVQKKVICNCEVARADYNASKVVQHLFRSYYNNPRLLHSGTIHGIFIQMLKHKNRAVAESAINLEDSNVEIVNEEIRKITKHELDEVEIKEYIDNKKGNLNSDDIVLFEKRRILVRAIVDYIAGMTDGFAMQEFKKIVG